MFTGVRRGGLLGLRWKDIDLENNKVKFVQQLVKVGVNNTLRELKTGSSQNRTVIIPGEVSAVLKEHKEKKMNEYRNLGYSEKEINIMMKDGLVYTNSLGGALQPRNFTRSFKLALISVITKSPPLWTDTVIMLTNP